MILIINNTDNDSGEIDLVIERCEERLVALKKDTGEIPEHLNIRKALEDYRTKVLDVINLIKKVIENQKSKTGTDYTTNCENVKINIKDNQGMFEQIREIILTHQRERPIS